MKGFNFESSTRSSLGWEMIRLLKEVKVKPKYVIFENGKVVGVKNGAPAEIINAVRQILDGKK